MILAGRPDKNPGQFKSQVNRVGETVFVEPDLVLGTLHRGWDLIPTLQNPMARAIYAMFLVAEVHPFSDGNGRIARIMMNAELPLSNGSANNQITSQSKLKRALGRPR